jgi:hypothetical protein
MTRTIEVEIDDTGRVHPMDPNAPLPRGRALLTWPTDPDHDMLLFSEASLAENWLGPEEDAAWAHLQPEK